MDKRLNWLLKENLKMSSHNKNYIENRCEEILKKIGIKKGQVILDFGCGVGNYTIPAAKIIGKKERYLL